MVLASMITPTLSFDFSRPFGNHSGYLSKDLQWHSGIEDQGWKLGELCT